MRRALPALVAAAPALLALMAHLGCTSAVQPSEAPDHEVEGVAARPEVTRPDATATAAAEAPSEVPPAAPACAYPEVAPRRYPALQSAPSGRCEANPAKVRRAVKSEVKRAWKRTWRDGTLEIRDGCDPTEGPLESVVIEGAGGHGGSLTLAELRRRDDGDYDLVVVEYNHYFGAGRRDAEDPWTQGTNGALEIRRGTLAKSRAEPLFTRMRALLALEIEEREPPPRPGAYHSGSHSFSSNDFHAALRLTDAGGVGVQRHYTGYESSGPEQRDGVPLSIALDDAYALLGDEALRATWTVVDASDPGARDLLARVFWEERGRGERIGSWFVHERLLALAARLGEPELMPALLDDLRTRERTAVERVHVLAVAAIAAITGFDVRHDADGAPRPIEVVREETLAACGRR
ncbi:MAG: hypothetical protein R3B09_22725 [Nannocystaceae bacterium]